MPGRRYPVSSRKVDSRLWSSPRNSGPSSGSPPYLRDFRRPGRRGGLLLGLACFVSFYSRGPHRRPRPSRRTANKVVLEPGAKERGSVLPLSFVGFSNVPSSVGRVPGNPSFHSGVGPHVEVPTPTGGSLSGTRVGTKRGGVHTCVRTSFDSCSGLKWRGSSSSPVRDSCGPSSTVDGGSDSRSSVAGDTGWVEVHPRRTVPESRRDLPPI